MSTSSDRRNSVEALAEEFLERLRRGEPATPAEYTERYPELADEIRAVFPSLLMMEDPGSEGGSRTDAVVTEPGAAHGAIGMRLGEFRLLREIGRGGMGIVYEAEQESLGRRVALKMLLANLLTDAQQVRRFQREARSAARLHHTHIVPVFGVGHHDGTHFYVMQFIQGQGLDGVLVELRHLRDARSGQPAGSDPAMNRGPTDRPPAADIAVSLASGRFTAGLNRDDSVTVGATVPWSEMPDDPGTVPSAPGSGRSSDPGQSGVATLPEADRWFSRGVARIGLQVAEALAYAHLQGILHRDIKPSNLLLDRDGNVWVADFGLAKGVGSDDLTHTGDVVGTLRYMAPERFRGEEDPRGDIYSLGLTLYELLALRPAYGQKDRASLIRQVTQEEPPRLRTLNRRVPADLETIVQKAMAREPAQRYETAGAMAEDLRRFLEGRPIRARRVSAAERAWRWCKRNPLIAALVGGIALAMILGTAVATYFAIRASQGEWLARQNEAKALDNARRADFEAFRTKQAAQLATEQAQRADQEAQRARAAKRLSDHRLYLAEMSLAQQAWHEGQINLVERYLQAYDPHRPEDPDRRGFEWYYLNRLCQLEVRTLRGHTDNVMGVAFSPDGRRIASASEDGTVKLWDAAEGRELTTFRGHTSHVLDLAFSPDGRRIASGGMDRIVRVWDAATAQEVATLRGHSSWIMGVAYSPDGRLIASGGADQTVKIWDAVAGRELHTLSGHQDAIWDVAFSPDGRRIASAGADVTVKLWDTATGQDVLTLHGHRGPIWGVAFSPDGRHVASAGGDHTVKIWDLATGQDVLTLRGHSARVINVAFSPDGRRLASTSEDHTVKYWETVTGQDVLTLRGHRDLVWGVMVSPDGRRLASASNDRTVRLWDVGEEQAVMTLRGHVSQVTDVTFSPDGRRIASGGDDGSVRLWDATTGEGLITLRGRVYSVRSLAFSPDGRRIASALPDHTVKIWDAAAGRVILTLRGHRLHVHGVAYSPDGRRVASASHDRTVKVWDAVTGQEIVTLRGHEAPVLGVAFSPDGRLIASAGEDHTVRLWDAAVGREIATLRGHSEAIRDVAFSPDGRLIASAGGDRTIRLWDAMTGRPAQVLRGHAAAVLVVAFSPDGHRMASGGGDHTVRLWDVTTGQEVLALRGHTSGVLGVAFSPDGHRIVSGSDDHTVKIWDATPLTPELRVLREARGVVVSLFAQPLPAADVLDRIRRDATISEPVRARALALAGPYGHSRVVREAELRVMALFGRPLLRPEVRESLRGDPSLIGTVRREALALAEECSEDPGLLEAASWRVVRRPDAARDAYQLAFRQAEAACRLIPDHGLYLTTLGMAQYRLGQYREAAATMEQAEQLNTFRFHSPMPADLAFLAMSRYRLGQTDRARAALTRLREMLKKPEQARDDEAHAFLREAEGLEMDLAFPADPLALNHGRGDCRDAPIFLFTRSSELG